MSYSLIYCRALAQGDTLVTASVRRHTGHSESERNVGSQRVSVIQTRETLFAKAVTFVGIHTDCVGALVPGRVGSVTMSATLGVQN